tara:strand:- start:61 stop:447 length:387 start_codon:yes stop_codon:yes gene_type:complete
MKTFTELYEDASLAKALKRKIKMRQVMTKLAKSSSFQMKKKKALLKMRNPAKLAVVARKKAKQFFRDKFYPGYKDMSMMQKIKVDQLIQQKYGKKIDKTAKKMVIKLQKAEIGRVKTARAAVQSKKEN